MDRVRLAKLLDHSFLRPETTAAEVRAGCLEVANLGVGCVCVRPCDVELAAQALAGSGIAIAAVIGFPHGSTTSATKAFEVADALRLGATEFDMVMNVGALRGGDVGAVEHDIREVVKASEGMIVKVILETAYLTNPEKVAACKAAESAGAAFVKTSTGFGPSGATLDDIRLMKATVGDRLGVKASGGIRTLESVLAFIEAGATRIGTSSSRSILESFVQPP